MDFNAWLLAAATEIVEAAEGEAYAAAKRLKRENKRFVNTVHAQLHGRVSLSCSLKQRYVPELRLRLEYNWLREAQGATLLAFAQLAQYAERFDAHSAEKAAFYDLVQKKLVNTPLAVISTQLIGKQGSPRFIVDIVECVRGASREDSIDELVTMMTIPALSQENKALVRAFLRDSVRLRFKRCDITANCLLLLQQGLDQVTAQPVSSRLSLSLLSLKHQKMDHEHFAVLTDIMKKNHEVYGIRELELDNTLTRSEDLPAFERLLSAIFQLSPHAAGSGRIRCGATRSLRRLSLSRNALSCRPFAVICSALRYGSTVEELSLAGTMNGMGVSERQVCWRWLAFGLFYPRSRKLTDRGGATEFKLRRIDLSGLMRDQGDVDAFVTMLQDPVTGLNLTHCQLRICTIKPRSVVREAADEASPVILAFADDHHEEDEFEVFYERDGWTCVVVPALGLGWIVTASRILKTELPISTPAGVRPLYDMTMSSAKLWASCVLPAQPFLSFITSIGPRIRSLDLSGTAFTSAHVPALAAVATHCIHLQKLVLDKCGFNQPSSSELLRALGGDVLGLRLTLLSLNECIYEATDCRAVERICTLLGDATKLPRLKHLHLNSSECTQRALSILHDALPARKRLTVLELRVPPPSLPPQLRVTWRPAGLREGGDAATTPVFVTRQIFDAKFYNECGGLHLSRKKKSAFLSVLKHYQETPLLPANRFHALGDLDVVMVRIIFQFATCKAHRKVLWRQLIHYT